MIFVYLKIQTYNPDIKKVNIQSQPLFKRTALALSITAIFHKISRTKTINFPMMAMVHLRPIRVHVMLGRL